MNTHNQHEKTPLYSIYLCLRFIVIFYVYLKHERLEGVCCRSVYFIQELQIHPQQKLNTEITEKAKQNPKKTHQELTLTSKRERNCWKYKKEFEDTIGLIRRRNNPKMNIQYNTIQWPKEKWKEKP